MVNKQKKILSCTNDQSVSKKDNDMLSNCCNGFIRLNAEEDILRQSLNLLEGCQ